MNCSTFGHRDEDVVRPSVIETGTREGANDILGRTMNTDKGHL
jgi:hypothetical protein